IMKHTSRITPRQTIFLRSLVQSPPDPAAWPSPTILRRWLRRPPFLRALDTLRQTLNYASDLLLAYAASSAALALHQPPLPDSSQSKIDNPKSKIDLLKLSHLRQRFPSAITTPTPRRAPDPTEQAVHERLMQMLQLIHPEANAREALEFFEQRIQQPHDPSDDSESAQLTRRQSAIDYLQTHASAPSPFPSPP
ncbi:MAG: hypothetical protein NTU53_00820, partial [Planctomycetota bacterium]|nr:hypothetical protein [Planctomycetota bacterium]